MARKGIKYLILLLNQYEINHGFQLRYFTFLRDRRSSITDDAGYSLSGRDSFSFDYPENEASNLLWNIGASTPIYTEPCLRRTES
jgi:hypothetical protein